MVQLSPTEGDEVKVLFRNGQVEEGLVVFWSDEKAVLKSLRSENIFIIQNTTQDVMGIKICSINKKPAEETVAERIIKLSAEKPAELKTKRLAELCWLKKTEEEKRIKAHLLDTSLGARVRVNYGIPRTIQKEPGPPDSSGQEG